MRRYLPVKLGLFWAGLVAGIPVSLVWLDRPVALYCSHLAAWRPLFQACAVPSLLALPVSGLCLAWAVLRKIRKQAPLRFTWLAMSVATLAATAAKDELKWVFGRSWPQFWLSDGVYGFRPFTESYFYGGFPSGHTAYIAAPLGVLWALRPRLRWLWGGIILLVMLGLVGADYHYLADVLAGLLTGSLCAWATLVLLPRA